MKLHYHLAQACKNTFILIDHLDENYLNDEALESIHHELMKTGRDDAIILTNGKSTNENSLFITMIVLGVDKQTGDFCGNGARAAAAYLFSKYKQYKKFFINTSKGAYALLKSEQDTYTVELPLANFEINPKFISYAASFQKDEHFYTYRIFGHSFVYSDVLEPHLLLPIEISNGELQNLGHKINQDRSLFPAGINITAFHIKSPGLLNAVTYERGVKRLTMSCGTGASCAASYYLKDKMPKKALVQNPGGTLEITLQKHCIALKGPAHCYFET